MAVDDSSLLPKAPPPRPAARDAAIGAAMRRFDGVEDKAARPNKIARRGWGSRPQFGLAVSMSLVAVIGIPAAMIAIRNADVAPPPEAPTSAPAPRAAPSADAVVDVENQPEPAARMMDVARPVPKPQPDRIRVLADEAPVSVAQRKAEGEYAAPVAAVAAPPPPAPPSASAAETRDEAASSSIVVTGSRIRSPGLAAEPEADSGAPDWVLDDRAYATFLNRLQNAVRSNDRNAVASMIAYPVRVNSNGKSRSYSNRRALLADYDQVFTARVRSAILNQRFEQLFGRDQGVMIGDGAVWFDHICRNQSCSPPGPVRIHAINP